MPITKKAASNEPFSIMEGEPPLIAAERAVRRGRWNDLQERTSGRSATWNDLGDCYIFRPRGQGIWIDAVRTRGSDAPYGIAHSILLSDAYGEEPPTEERFVYRYPRPSSRSRQEISAIKAAREVDLPLFVVDSISSRGAYLVTVAWVIDFYDKAEAFLFGRSRASEPERAQYDLDDSPFEETTSRRRTEVSRLLRPGQRNFRFDVMSRYEAQRALCDLEVPDLLRAAHIRPVQNQGSDDARNGLLLCENHHLAFDAGLIRIHADSLRVEVPKMMTHQRLQITRKDLHHLSKRPAGEALRWRSARYKPYSRHQYAK